MVAHRGPLDNPKIPELRNRQIAPEKGWRIIDIAGAPERWRQCREGWPTLGK